MMMMMMGIWLFIYLINSFTYSETCQMEITNLSLVQCVMQTLGLIVGYVSLYSREVALLYSIHKQHILYYGNVLTANWSG